MAVQPYATANSEPGDPLLILDDAAFRYQPNAICSACDYLLSRVVTHVSALCANKTQFDHQRFESSCTYDDMATSARLGCHFCQIVVTLGNFWQRDSEATSNVSLELKWTLDAYIRDGSYGIKTIIPGTGVDLVVHQAAGYASKEQTSQKPARAPPLGRRTDDDDTFEVATAWLHTCLANHAFCADGLDKTRRPRRLLALGWCSGEQNQDPSVRLVNAAEVPVKEEYVALSHCWGTIPIITTTTKTEQSFRQAIDFRSLSTTFRDAVRITLRLGYRMLWIDSLCIIQDSKADWEEQSAIMGSVYSNSVLTIAALDSQDGSGGCFAYDRCLLGLQPLSLPNMDIILEPPAHDEWTARVYNTGKDAPPLHQRAWVVQERILSPRTLYYGTCGIYWECRHVLATESWTQNAPPSQGHHLRKMVLHEMERDTKCTMMAPHKEDLHNEFATRWRGLLSEYSGCMLTQWTDRLTAMAGLIAEIGRRTDFNCVLGIWTHDLPGMLMWQRGFLSGEGSKYPPKRLENGMPTWTWASLPGRIDYHLTRGQEKTLWQAGAALEGAEKKTLRLRSCRRKVVMRLKKEAYRYLSLDPADERSKTLQHWGGDITNKWDWEPDLAAPHPDGNVARTLWVVPVKIVEWKGHTYKDGALLQQCATAGCLVITTVKSMRNEAAGRLNACNASSEDCPEDVFFRVGFVWLDWTTGEGSPFQIVRAGIEEAGHACQDQTPDGIEDLVLI